MDTCRLLTFTGCVVITGRSRTQSRARARRMSRAFAFQVCGASTSFVTRRTGPALPTAARRSVSRGVPFPITNRAFSFTDPRGRDHARVDTMATRSSQSGTEAPAFTFGLLADIQYADVDDKPNFTGTQWRRYRNSLVVAKDAVTYFNEHDLDFALHNGDIIDHQCAFDFANDEFRPKREALDQLGEVMSVLKNCACKNWHFTVGNHELYNFTREELRNGVRAPAGNPLPFKCANEFGDFHYSFAPAAGWKVIVLDSYDVSIYRNGREEGLDEHALALLCEKNENCKKFVAENPDVLVTERMSGTFPYFKNLTGLESRWVPFNGGLGEAQLGWVKTEIDEAARKNERVVLFSHLLGTSCLRVSQLPPPRFADCPPVNTPSHHERLTRLVFPIVSAPRVHREAVRPNLAVELPGLARHPGAGGSEGRGRRGDFGTPARRRRVHVRVWNALRGDGIANRRRAGAQRAVRGGAGV